MTEGRGRKPEVREAGMRGCVIGDENIRLQNVKK